MVPDVRRISQQIAQTAAKCRAVLVMGNGKQSSYADGGCLRRQAGIA